MAAILKVAWISYNGIFEKYAVSYSGDELFLMSSPWPMVAISVAYVYFVTNLGPRLMKNRPPFNVERIINVYNLGQIAYSIYLIRYVHTPLDYHGFPWFNAKIHYEDSELGRYVYKGMHVYHILKLIDFLDTVFFVLRKKNRQITFLHVYHHVSMYIVTWVLTKFFPGGHGIIVGYINCYVHIIMYSYYFITSMWPEYKKNLWWKKYITIAQMVQFSVVIADTLPLFFMKETNCPKPLAVVILFQNTVMFIMFSNFYQKTYLKKEKSKI